MDTNYVLMVEDNPTGIPEAVRSQLAARSDIEVDLLHPSDITEDALRAASIVVLDHRLENWDDREAQSSISLQPKNGVALASVLRSCLVPETIGSDLTAFCLLTGHPDDLVGVSPHERRPQVLARSKDLEWVFSKDQPTEVADQIASLAECVGLIRELASKKESLPRYFVETTLRVDSTEIHSDLLWSSIERCQPPLIEIDEWSAPMHLVRWLLHRILPYSTFLYGDIYLAERLQVSLPSLLNCIDQGTSDLAKRLESCRYDGVLRSFIGKRWWRSAVDSLLWSESNEGAISKPELRASLQEKSFGSLVSLEIEEPVVCLDERLSPASIEALADTVRLQPDDWPAFARVPRVLLQSACKSDRLRLLTMEDDLEMLESDEGASE